MEMGKSCAIDRNFQYENFINEARNIISEVGGIEQIIQAFKSLATNEDITECKTYLMNFGHQCRRISNSEAPMHLNNFKFYIMRLAKWFRWVFPAKNKTNESINIVNSIAKAKKLHKELILYAHPDRHPNNQELATRLSERINENRFNYSELLKLQDIINKELYIKE